MNAKIVPNRAPASGRILSNGDTLGTATLVGADMFTWIADFSFDPDAGPVEQLLRRQHALDEAQLEGGVEYGDGSSGELESITEELDGVVFSFDADDGRVLTIENVRWSPGRLEFRIGHEPDRGS